MDPPGPQNTEQASRWEAFQVSHSRPRFPLILLCLKLHSSGSWWALSPTLEGVLEISGVLSGCLNAGNAVYAKSQGCLVFWNKRNNHTKSCPSFSTILKCPAQLCQRKNPAFNHQAFFSQTNIKNFCTSFDKLFYKMQMSHRLYCFVWNFTMSCSSFWKKIVSQRAMFFIDFKWPI